MKLEIMFCASQNYFKYKKNDNRDKRSPSGLIVGSTILSGVFGTLMGWFTHKRLTNLQEQVNEVKNEQHRLLQIQTILHKLQKNQKT